MGSVFFLNCFTILSDFCFSWQICPPQQSHCCLLPTQSQPYGVGSSSRAHTLGPHKGRWEEVPHVGLSQTLQTQRCFVSPGTSENGPKSFRAAPVYSRVKPELQACLKMPPPLTSWVSVHTLHAWCPHIRYCCSCNFPSFRDHLT